MVRARGAVARGGRRGAPRRRLLRHVRRRDPRDRGRRRRRRGARAGPARSITVRSGPWDGCGVNAAPLAMNWRGRVLERRDDGAITRARFEPPEYWKWGRVEVVSVDGAQRLVEPLRRGLSGRPRDTVRAMARDPEIAIRIAGRDEALRPDHGGRRPRPRRAGGHVRRAARTERRGEVDDHEDADRPGDRRRGRARGARLPSSPASRSRPGPSAASSPSSTTSTPR